MKNTIPSVMATLRAAEWMPTTAARILIGVFFCISGGTKLLVPAQFRKMELTLAESHIPLPHANAIFVSLVEFACGGGLALGLLTPVCAVLAWLDDFLYLPEVLYVLILVWLIFSGPGRYSVDGLLARRAGVVGIERRP